MLDFIETRDIDGLLFYAVIRICITLVCWFFVICSCLVDFWSGTNTAKALGESLQSHGFRRTIIKIGDYWRVLIFALMFDILGAFLPFYVLPFTTILCTISIICIEGKSVIENSGRKKAHAAEVPDMVKAIVEAATSEQGAEVLNKIAEGLSKTKKHENY